MSAMPTPSTYRKTARPTPTQVQRSARERRYQRAIDGWLASRIRVGARQRRRTLAAADSPVA